MSDTNNPESQSPIESNESFDQLLSQYERSHARLREDGGKQLEGTVIAITADSVLLDIGYRAKASCPWLNSKAKARK